MFWSIILEIEIPVILFQPDASLQLGPTHARFYHQGVVVFNMLPKEVKLLSCFLSINNVMKGFLAYACLYSIRP